MSRSLAAVAMSYAGLPLPYLMELAETDPAMVETIFELHEQALEEAEHG